MASVIEICNFALSNIRAGSINSLDEGSVQAQQCKLKFNILRDRCLTDIPWQFSRTIRALAPVTTEVFGWPYVYSYPVDCLKINRLVGPSEEASAAGFTSAPDNYTLVNRGELRRQIPYEVFNFSNVKVIGTDTADLRIDFTKKVDDPTLFSNDFVMALSHLLAAEIAIPIVGAEMGRALRSDSLQLYEKYLKSAMANDMNDQYIIPPESEYVSIRR